MKNSLITTGIAGAALLIGSGCSLLPLQNPLNTTLADKGAVQLDLPGAARSTQARMTDINNVLFTLESANRASNAPSLVAIATKSIEYVDGIPSEGWVLFNNLWPGVATLSATVYGANPIRTQGLHTQSLLQPIGSATATASVVAGQVTQVPLNIKLDTTQTQAGGLNINLAVQEGDEELLPLPYQVTTLAGNTVHGSNNGSGTAASFYYPYGIANDGAGNLYVGDSWNHRIRKITPNGDVTTLAGSGFTDFTSGNGLSASFYGPYGVTVDTAGTVYVADTWHHMIRKIAPNGDVTTFAGNLTAGSNDGMGTAASFKYPYGLAFDAAGILYVADTYNEKIRKITPDGNVTTVAGNGMYWRTNGNGTAASFYNPYGIAVDASGNLYVADTNNNMIRKIAPNGDVTTFAGNPTAGSNDGTGTAASFHEPTDLVVDASGNLYVTDSLNNMIRRITPNGRVTTIAGNTLPGSNNGLGTAASFFTPQGIAIDADENLYITDGGNHMIRKLSH